MDPILKRKVAGGVAALTVLAGAGGAYAVSKGSPGGAGTRGAERDAFVADVAKRLKVSPGELNDAFKGAIFDRLDRDVAAGRLTQKQANAIKREIARRGAVVPGPFPGFGMRGPHGPGAPPPPGGPPPPPPPGSAPRYLPNVPPPPRSERRGGMRGPAGGGPMHKIFDAAADYLGLTPRALRRELFSGKSLADVAKEHGKDVDGLKDAIAGAVRGQLDDLVNRKWPPRPPGPPGRGWHRRHHHR